MNTYLFRVSFLVAALLLMTSLTGCGPSVKEQDIEVKASNDPLSPARAVLQRYARGEPLGSEVTSFPHLVSEVRKVDPTRADILEKGLASIQKAPANRSAIAKSVLQKLAPSPNPM